MITKQETAAIDRLLKRATTLSNSELATLKAHSMYEDLVRLPVEQAKTIAIKLKQGYQITNNFRFQFDPDWASVQECLGGHDGWRVWSIPQYELAGMAEVEMKKKTNLGNHSGMSREVMVRANGTFTTYTWEP